jgi:hypothetical protein
MSIRSVAAVLLSILIAAGALAQVRPEPAGTPPEKMDGGAPSYVRPETPEQRRTRLGTAEDPGHNPDPKVEYWRFGHRYIIEKYDRKFAAYDAGPGQVRPFAMANFAYEIYQQNDKYVWVWMPLPDPQPEPTPGSRPLHDAPAEKVSPFTKEQTDYLKKIAPEYEPVSVPTSGRTVRFEESSQGLPTGGSWRNSGDLADMNGDGHVDVLAPPQRGMSTLPTVFLGDGKGGWKIWNSVWPYEIQYGNVIAADFNGDKKMDVAAGVHLAGVRVFLGDGKGNFTDASKGLPMRDFPTRRVVASDVDADGDQDLLAIYEGPSGMGGVNGSRVRAFLNQNRASEWKWVNAAAPEDINGGDWLATGRFNDDKYPDFVTSSNYFQATDLLYRSVGAAKWEKFPSDGFLIPFLSVHSAVATGRLSSKKYDDAVISFSRHWPKEIDPSIVATPTLNAGMVGLDRISFAGREPKRVPLVRFASERAIGGVAVADFDGDRNADIIYTQYDPREFVLLLGDGKGGFVRATLEGIQAEENPNYDVHVGDVNADGRLDVMVMYESNAESRLGEQNGSIHVFLNRGPVKAAAAR